MSGFVNTLDLKMIAHECVNSHCVGRLLLAVVVMGYLHDYYLMISLLTRLLQDFCTDYSQIIQCAVNWSQTANSSATETTKLASVW